MRCPDCSKFVSMDNGEPEVNDCSAEFGIETFTVHIDGRHTRNCADCGTELKSRDWDAEDEVGLDQFEGWKELSEAGRKAIVDAANNGDFTCECDSADVDESGGSRYAKNMITITAHYSIEIEAEVEDQTVKVTCSRDVESEEQASGYEECC